MDWMADDLDTLFEVVSKPITIEIMFDLPYMFDAFRFVISSSYGIQMYSEGDTL